MFEKAGGQAAREMKENSLLKELLFPCDVDGFCFCFSGAIEGLNLVPSFTLYFSSMFREGCFSMKLPSVVTDAWRL